MARPVTPITATSLAASNAPLAHLPFDMPLPDDIIEDVEPREVELPNLAVEQDRQRRAQRHELERRLEMWSRRYEMAIAQLRDIRDLGQLEYEEQVMANLRRARQERRRLAIILGVEEPRPVNLLADVEEVSDVSVQDREDTEEIE